MKSNKRMTYCKVLMLGVGYASLISAENQARMPILNTCEYWSSKDDMSLEVGRVVLHFSEYPIVNSLPSTKQGAHHHVFFIPAAGIKNNDMRFIMQAARQNNNKWYKISLSFEKKPIPGIKIVLIYDPEKVIMEHSAFDTLGLHKGVCFTLYNKSMLDALRSNERSLLRVVCIASHVVVA